MCHWPVHFAFTGALPNDDLILTGSPHLESRLYKQTGDTGWAADRIQIAWKISFLIKFINEL